jgi:hypothetical protein
MSRLSHIKVPADAVRTPEQILEGLTVTHGGKYVWTECHHCGGSGTYPSSMTPPGMCRFYCWQDRTPETYGKRATPVEKFVKDAQARDRRAYRERIQWELDAPKREEAAKAEAARQEAIRAEEERMAKADLERKAISQHQGALGERLTVSGRVVMVRSFQKRHFVYSNQMVTQFVTKLRDAQGNVFVWFGSDQYEEGTQITVKGTVKEHGQYDGEKQTTINRVKEI